MKKLLKSKISNINTSMKNIFLFLVLSIFSFSAFAQSKDSKWAVTFGSASVLYSVEDASELRSISALKGGSRYILLFPRLSVARYMFKNVTFVASIASSFKDTQKYTSFDGEARYDFGTSENKLSPYISIGGSFIDAHILLPTLNFGAGGTLWISDRFGVNGQLNYRYNEERFRSQRSHLFGSAGLVFLFSSKGNKSVIRDSGRKRIWEVNH